MDSSISPLSMASSRTDSRITSTFSMQCLNPFFFNTSMASGSKDFPHRKVSFRTISLSACSSMIYLLPFSSSLPISITASSKGTRNVFYSLVMAFSCSFLFMNSNPWSASCSLLSNVTDFFLFGISLEN